jgi:hypothetical protein
MQAFLNSGMPNVEDGAADDVLEVYADGTKRWIDGH